MCTKMEDIVGLFNDVDGNNGIMYYTRNNMIIIIKYNRVVNF